MFTVNNYRKKTILAKGNLPINGNLPLEAKGITLIG